ncbi:FG-GAP-like repeat-containing protein [Hymenobacter rubidus]|uniref:FG-GAP-like repeat-containing protein n=1 Tax=Hymenobacter rubidus TaxID=1441626 RepID=UPI00191DEE0B|nr:FG-GAP-like repeat-containing protein [Hymenobacter rubidus]
MKSLYGLPPIGLIRAFASVFVLGMELTQAGVAKAQPTVTAVVPVANAQAAPRTGAVTVTFSQALTAGSSAALKVYSAQRGGLRTRGTTPAVVSGNTLTFAPTAYRFMPGEAVSSTVTTAAASSSGNLAQSKVVQFTAAVAGTGRGSFVVPGADFTVGTWPVGIAVGDINGDGQVDLLTSNGQSSSVTTLLNTRNGSNGFGTFFVTGTLPVGGGRLILGDVDGDGDLDLVTGNNNRSVVSVRLNGGDASGSGTGTFGNGSDLPSGDVFGDIRLGDVDGDGDLDLVIPNENLNNVAVRLNGGDATGSNTGTFSSGSTIAVTAPHALALGDVDGDGDLDLVVTSNNSSSNNVSVRLNGGDATGSNTGIFSNGSTNPIPTLSYAGGIALGDVDGDGDLDMVVSGGSNTATATIRLNGGDATGTNAGTFSNGSVVPVDSNPYSVALADVDADGDLDLLAGTRNGSVSVRLNGGDAAGSNTGVFSNGSNVRISSQWVNNIAVGDVDSDGDLDILTVNDGNTASVRLNGGTQLATTSAHAAAGGTLVVSPTVGTGEDPHYAYTGEALAPGTTLAVYSLMGQCVWQQTTAVTATGTLPVTGLSSGWYFATLRTAMGSVTTRFFKP